MGVGGVDQSPVASTPVAVAYRSPLASCLTSNSQDRTRAITGSPYSAMSESPAEAQVGVKYQTLTLRQLQLLQWLTGPLNAC